MNARIESAPDATLGTLSPAERVLAPVAQMKVSESAAWLQATHDRCLAIADQATARASEVVELEGQRGARVEEDALYFAQGMRTLASECEMAMAALAILEESERAL